MRRWTAAIFLAAILLAETAGAQPSQVQRCEALKGQGDHATLEYCKGIFAANSYGGPRDIDAAIQHYKKAAEMGHVEAQAVMGVTYERGTNVPQDYQKAAQWYEKAAGQGHAGAQLNLGQMYAKGQGVPRDPAKARQLIEAAAKQGLPPAQRALAELRGGTQSAPGDDFWKQGKTQYLAGDKKGAVPLFLKAANAGHPEAMYEMGYLYENGDGVAKDIKQAAGWYRKGAEAGDRKAQRAIGIMYENGTGVPENWIEAAAWYRKSAQANDVIGQYMLGRAYQYGIGVPLSLTDAITWYDKAAAQGDGDAGFAAKYLRDNHGLDGSSRDQEEQAMLGPLMKRMFPHAPPAGAVFRNKAERLAYVRAVASDDARAAQQMEHDMQQRRYDDCRRGGGQDCHMPVTPAPR
jgi:uncharacterized protein